MKNFNNKYLVFITLISISFQLIGCSSTYLVTPSEAPKTDFTYSGINDELSGEAVCIVLSDSTEFYGKNFRIENDSAKWIDQKSNIIKTVHIKEIKTVVTKNHILGALEGFGIGLTGGLALGFILFNPFEAGGGHFGGPAAAGAAIATLVFTSVGGTVGTLIGAIIAQRYYYKFKHEQKDKKPIENEKQEVSNEN